MKYKCPKCGKEEKVEYYCCGDKLCSPVLDDQQVVERFNELWRNNKVACFAGEKNYTDWYFRLCPTPRYRPFTAVEAAMQLGRIIRSKDRPNVRETFTVWKDGIIVDEMRRCDFKEALEIYVFVDTGEPFGVKLED